MVCGYKLAMTAGIAKPHTTSRMPRVSSAIATRASNGGHALFVRCKSAIHILLVMPVAKRFIRNEASRAEAAQVRNDYSVARRAQHGCHVNVGMDVVEPAMKENNNRTVGWANFGVTNA
jgi:hypothetical protein